MFPPYATGTSSAAASLAGGEWPSGCVWRPSASSAVRWPPTCGSRHTRWSRSSWRGRPEARPSAVPPGYFAPIVGTWGFSALLGTAVDDLLAEAVDPRALSEAADRSRSPSLRALSAIFAVYVSELERREWLHPAQIALTAADAVKGRGAPAPVVMLDGFQLFRGGELALLEALAGRSEVVVTLDPGAGARARHDYQRLLGRFPDARVVELGSESAVRQVTVTAGDAPDREGQMRAIARQIKQRLTDQPLLRPSDFAVAFRQVSPHLGMARQVFQEYDLPLDPAAGQRLSARPLGVWLRRVLSLARDGWRLRDFVAVLSSGFVDLERWRPVSRTRRPVRQARARGAPVGGAGRHGTDRGGSPCGRRRHEGPRLRA